ncbi:MAG: hypothetical protein JWL69_5060 [Phycisphaerales bacterium]|nr:hypothetical protein [Phycisphaerales bacterium]
MKMRAKQDSSGEEARSPQEALLGYIDLAVGCSKTARKHNQSLSGSNFYASKMADLRADATNEFGRLGGGSVGDTSALAKLMQKVFSSDATATERAQAAQDLRFALKTTWADAVVDNGKLEEGGVFPLVTLIEANRGYLVSVGRQANGCYAAGWYDACAVMMRRLLESSIIEAFEAKGIDAKIKDPKTGDFFQLTALIIAALAETAWNLPRNVRREIDSLRDLGHRSAHNRYYLAKKPDIDKHAGVYRETVEAFLHIAHSTKRRPDE